jgi:hypothetical protein
MFGMMQLGVQHKRISDDSSRRGLEGYLGTGYLLGVVLVPAQLDSSSCSFEEEVLFMTLINFLPPFESPNPTLPWCSQI